MCLLRRGEIYELPCGQRVECYGPPAHPWWVARPVVPDLDTVYIWTPADNRIRVYHCPWDFVFDRSESQLSTALTLDDLRPVASAENPIGS